ncbi:MAG TPA: MMPL family transporter [Acidimicrobiales bacterium]|nr:MMPL family transporter [Acidimicrobiales bacterium]
MVETARARFERQLARLALLVTGRLASWIGVVFWLAVVAASVPFATKLASVESSRITEFLPAGADSTRALELDSSFPSGRAPSAEVVFFRSSGLTAPDMALVRDVGPTLEHRLHGAVGTPSAPVRSANGKVAVVSVPVLGDENAVLSTVTRMRAVLGNGAGGVEVRVSGSAAIQADLLGAFSGADTLLLVATAGLVMVLLALTYRSPVLWIVPLACVGIAEAVAEAVIYGLARAGLTVNAQSTALVTVIVFGAGTDYALLLTARYREELRRHPEHRRAMVVAWRRAAPAIVASSATVAATLACLLPAKLSLTSGFGIVGIVGVLAAAFVILAAYPALLLVMGRGVFWPAVPRHAPDFVQRGVWVRLGRIVSRGHRPVWIAGFVILGGAAVAVLTVNTNVSSLNELPASAQSVEGYKVLVGNFPDGEVSPVDVVVTSDGDLGAVRRALGKLPVTAALGPAEHAGGMARFDLILAVSPNGNTGFDAIRRVRDAADQVAPGHVLVGGQTAQDLDTAVASHHDTLLVVPTALAVVLVVLWLLLRAVAGPVLVVVTVVATFGAALGLASAVVVPLLHLPGTDPTVPLLTFVFLVALGVDYNIFLLTRVREEVLRRGAIAGVDTGVASTGAVLTSAGVILAGTFSVLAVLPIVASREIGIVVAIGVLADTFLVRTILVPMIMADLKARFWWPSRPAPEGGTPVEAIVGALRPVDGDEPEFR